MHIKTNKDTTKVVFSNWEITHLTKEELGELVKIGYFELKCRPKELQNRFLYLDLYFKKFENYDNSVIEPIFKIFEKYKYQTRDNVLNLTNKNVRR